MKQMDTLSTVLGSFSGFRVVVLSRVTAEKVESMLYLLL